MRRLIAAALVGLSVGGAVWASASALGISSRGLGAGSGAAATCDDSVSTSYVPAFDTTEGYRATGVVVSGIAAGCNGRTVSATLVDSSDSPVSTANPVTISGSATTVTLTLPSPVAISTVGKVHVLIS